MPYEVIAKSNSVSILDEVTTHKNRVTGEDTPVYESRHWLKGQIIPDEKIADFILKQYEDGDEHVRSLIKKVEEKKSKRAVKQSE